MYLNYFLELFSSGILAILPSTNMTFNKVFDLTTALVVFITAKIASIFKDQHVRNLFMTKHRLVFEQK